MNVYEYFERELGYAGDLDYLDPSLRELDTLSECGRDCVAAIDAAKVFMARVAAAFGPRSANCMMVKQITATTIECFWRG